MLDVICVFSLSGLLIWPSANVGCRFACKPGNKRKNNTDCHPADFHKRLSFFPVMNNFKSENILTEDDVGSPKCANKWAFSSYLFVLRWSIASVLLNVNKINLYQICKSYSLSLSEKGKKILIHPSLTSFAHLCPIKCSLERQGASFTK